MKQHVTVVPSDRLIIVDGIPLCFAFSAPERLHALQWHGETGAIEWQGNLNQPLTIADYPTEVTPYVALWEAEKIRLEAEIAAAEAARLAAYNSTAARADRVRFERDRRIAATDYLMTADYPLPATQRSALTVYRQHLRNIPDQPGFPWTGEDDPAIPWPVLPTAMEVSV